MSTYTLESLSTFCNHHGWDNVTEDGRVQLRAWINDMIQLLAAQRDWPWYKKVHYLNLAAPYTTGTVTATEASTAIVGDGTTFAAGMAGQEFYCGEDANRLYQIASYTDTTHLTLAGAYVNSTAAGATYAVRYVRYDQPSDFDHPRAFLLEQSGNELGWRTAGLADWHELRLSHQSTASWPTDVIVAGDYFYVHPAPSEARSIRCVYQAMPAEATHSTNPDWPTRFRYLLHELLRIELSTKTRDGMVALEDRRFERKLDQAYARATETWGPVTIQTRRGGAGRMTWQQAQGRISILDPDA